MKSGKTTAVNFGILALKKAALIDAVHDDGRDDATSQGEGMPRSLWRCKLARIVVVQESRSKLPDPLSCSEGCGLGTRLIVSALKKLN